MTDTVGEALFKHLCEDAGIRYRRVETASTTNEQRPDFILEGSKTAIVVEVKQFDATRAEADAGKRILRGEPVVTGGLPGARVREAIGKANSQIRELSKDTLPGLLVIHNNVFGHTHHTDPYAILTAMRGLDVVPVRLPTDLNEQPTFMPVRSGPKKKLTPTANTHTSAVAVLYESSGLGVRLDVFHNPNAGIHLSLTELIAPSIRHFAMRDDERDWRHIVPAD